MVVKSFDYDAAETTKFLEQYYGKKIIRDDENINQFFKNLNNPNKKRQTFPINYYVDPDISPLPIPTNMPTIKIGYVITDIPDYYALTFNKLAYQGLSLSEYLINRENGIIVNNTRYWIENVVYNGGPICSNFLILYQRLIEFNKVHAIISPVNSDCPEVSLLAEIYEIPVLNGVDYVLEASIATNPNFPKLKWTYSVVGDGKSLGRACLQPVFDLGARTYVIVYDPIAVKNTIPIIDNTAQFFGMIKLFNDTILSATLQNEAINEGRNCSYIWSMIDPVIEKKPDLIILSFGADHTDETIDCMHRRDLYQPPALWLVTGSTFIGENLWQTDWILSTDLWISRINFSDPFLGSVSEFNQTFAERYGTSLLSQISFSASNAEAVSILLSAITIADSLNPLDILNTLPDIFFIGILGDIYLENGTHHFHHEFSCLQRQNDSNPIGLPVFPYNIPGVIKALYPAPPLNASKEFLDSLKNDKLSKPQIVGILFGVIGFLILIIIIPILIVLYFRDNIYIFIKKPNNVI